MHEPPKLPAPKRKLPVLWIAIGTLVAMIGLFLFQLFGPNPPIVVSKQTTFITEPLGKDGLPDFEAYLLKRGSEGITTENNAAIPFWRAMWPGELAKKDWLPLSKVLGLPTTPSNPLPITKLDSESVLRLFALDYARHLAARSGEKGNVRDFQSEEWQSELADHPTEQLVDLAISHRWSTAQLPSVANWITERKQSFDLLIEATSRERYYSPSPSLVNGSAGPMWYMLLPDLQMHRYALKPLMLRAMWMLEEGREMAAWENLRAAHRLARQSTKTTGDTLVANMVGIAIENFACGRTQNLLHHGELTAKQLRGVLGDLMSLPQVSDCANSIDKSERLFCVDIVLRVAAGNPDAIEFLVGDEDNVGITKLTSTRLDWNFILRRCNGYLDKVVSAGQIRDRVRRQSKLQAIELELISEMKAETASQTSFNVKVSITKRAKAMSMILIALLAPAADAAIKGEDRAETQLELTKLAAALAVYRAEQGEYPDKLDQLVPSVIPKLPVDLYSGDSFIYQRKADGGYLLYSVYENEVDDGGSDFSGEIIDGEYVDDQPADFDAEESDLVVRVPVPPFKFPDPPPSGKELEFGEE